MVSGLFVLLGLLVWSPSALARAPAGEAAVGNLRAPDVAWPQLGSLPAASDPLTIAPAPPALAFTARRRPRPWFALSGSTFVANPARPGSRFAGMVIEESASGQLLGRCSGTVVDSPNGSVVWTAGHCIFRPAQSPTPYPVILFVPDAEPGAGPFAPTAPYGVWTAAAYALARDWARHGSVRRFKQDFGALLMSRNAQGQTIEQALGGAQRISFKGATSGRIEVRGYPAEGRFANSDSQIGCGPRAIGRYPRRLAGPGPRPVAIRCAMTEGASGGPWLAHVGRNGVGTLISNTSAASVKPGFLFGPVLNRVAHRVWAAMAHRAAP